MGKVKELKARRRRRSYAPATAGNKNHAPGRHLS